MAARIECVWVADLEDVLVEILEECPCLYNICSPDYSNKKEAALKEIAVAVEKTGRKDGNRRKNKDFRLIKPVFRPTPKNVTYFTGDTAVLMCSVENLEMNKVIWKKKKARSPISIGELVYVDKNVYDIKHISYKDEWNLLIYNVQPKHAGVYECQISVRENAVWRVRLNVIDKKTMRKPEIVIGGKQFVEKGDKLILTCNATGSQYPPEDIDWFKEGDKIRANSLSGIYITKYTSFESRSLFSELIIDKTDISHRGTYLCRSSDLEIATLKVIVLNSTDVHTNIRHEDDTQVQLQSMRTETFNRKRDYQTNYPKLEEQNTIYLKTKGSHGNSSTYRHPSHFMFILITSVFMSIQITK